MVDNQCLAAETGYWCAYFSHAKRPKPLKEIIKNITNSVEKNTDKDNNGNIDLDTFMRLEEKRMKLYSNIEEE